VKTPFANCNVESKQAKRRLYVARDKEKVVLNSIAMEWSSMAGNLGLITAIKYTDLSPIKLD